jgi:hypothetical protein
MAHPQLVNWVKEQQRNGYRVSQLRDFLVKEGYNANLVDESIKAANQRAAFAGKDKLINIAIALCGAFAVICGGLLLYL